MWFVVCQGRFFFRILIRMLVMLTCSAMCVEEKEYFRIIVSSLLIRYLVENLVPPSYNDANKLPKTTENNRKGTEQKVRKKPAKSH